MAVTYQNKDHWYLFLVFPFLAAITAVKNFRTPWSKNLIWAFVVFFGFTFGIAEEVSRDGGSVDIFRYGQELDEMYKNQSGFKEIIKIYQEGDDIDILKTLISYVISRFTNSMQILTTVYAFIFGFFFSRNIWFVLQRLNGKLKPAVVLLIVAYILVDPFWNINGFRFHTAVQIFVYGLLPFLFEGKKRGLLICSLTFLVHFSFVIPIAILATYIVLGNRTIIYFVFFLVSIVTSEVNLKSFNAFVEENAPASITKKTASYRSEGYVENFREAEANPERQNANILTQYWTKSLHWPLMIMLIILFFKRKQLKRLNKYYINGMSFTFLVWGVANLLSSLPSGARFLAIACMSALPLVIFFIQNLDGEKILAQKVMIFSPSLLLFIIVSIRAGFYFISVETILTNPFIAFFSEYSIALNDLIK